MNVSASQLRIKMITAARFQFQHCKALKCAVFTVCGLYWKSKVPLKEAKQNKTKPNRSDIIKFLAEKCLWTRDKLRQRLCLRSFSLAPCLSSSAMTHVKDTFHQLKEVILLCFHDMDMLIRTSVLKVRSRREMQINNKMCGVEVKAANTVCVKVNKRST